MGPAIQSLTGAPYYNTMHKEVGIDALWSYMNEKLAAGWMLTCASHTGTGSDKDAN